MSESASQFRKRRSLPPLLVRFTYGIVVLNVLCWAVEFLCGRIARLAHTPYNNLTLIPTDNYSDFIAYVLRFKHFHTPAFFDPRWGSPYLYPAPPSLLYEPFVFLSFGNDVAAAILFLFTFLAAACAVTFLFRRKLIQRGLERKSASRFVLIAFLFSYPLYFAFNRANIELFIWLLSAVGIYCVYRNRPWSAAALLGVAGACKFYPFVYLGFLFARRQYRQIPLALVTAAATTLVALWALTGNIALSHRETSAGVEQFRQIYVLHLRPLEIGLDHSLFGFYKRLFPVVPAPDQLAHQLSIYLVLAGAVAAALFLSRAMRLPFLNQLLFLTVVAITLPPTSYDYTLLHLYTGFSLLVVLAIHAWRSGIQPRGLSLFIACFAILLTPQNEIILHGERLEGPIKCFTLLALGYLALRYPLELPSFSGDTVQKVS